MPNPTISKITLPSGTTYDLKDEWARSAIAGITGGDAIVFIGVSSTPLTDGGNQLPTIDGSQVTPAAGQLFFYGSGEFVYGNDSKWHELGSLESLGDLAYKDEAEGNFTPSGTISQPVFTGDNNNVTITVTDSVTGNYQPKGNISGGVFSGSETTFNGKFTPEGEITLTKTNKTTTVSSTTGAATYTPAGTVDAPTISINTAGSTTIIKNPTGTTVAKTMVAAAPGQTAPANVLTYYSVNDETLSLYQLGYTTGDSITTSNVTVKTGDASYTASAPSFTGTGARLVTGNIQTVDNATFTGTQDDISVSGTPQGSNSKIDFTGTKVNISGTTTPSGTVSQPTFTGMQGTITVS